MQHRVTGTETLLERIEKDGDTNLPLTEENKSRGKLTGQPIQRKCFVCRKYLKADGSVCYRDTSYWCRHCQMLLCNKGRRQPELGQELNVEGGHSCPSSHVFRCSRKAERGSPAPASHRRAARVVPEPEAQQQIISPASVLRSVAEATQAIGTRPRHGGRVMPISLKRCHLSPSWYWSQLYG
jgi:hypothetical protein